jgi:hypothetical protein
MDLTNIKIMDKALKEFEKMSDECEHRNGGTGECGKMYGRRCSIRGCPLPEAVPIRTEWNAAMKREPYFNGYNL